MWLGIYLAIAKINQKNDENVAIRMQKLIILIGNSWNIQIYINIYKYIYMRVFVYYTHTHKYIYTIYIELYIYSYIHRHFS